MSLKAFHIFFIVVSTVFCLAFAIWEIREFIRGGGLTEILLAGLAVAGTAGLVFYGIRVVQKFKDARYV